MTMLRTVFRTCTLCEAMCGLKLELDGDRIISVRGDEDDPFSRGYICPKGVAIGEVHHDPDNALSDGAQSLFPAQFTQLMDELRMIAPAVGRTL